METYKEIKEFTKSLGITCRIGNVIEKDDEYFVICEELAIKCDDYEKSKCSTMHYDIINIHTNEKICDVTQMGSYKTISNNINDFISMKLFKQINDISEYLMEVYT